MWAIEIYCIDFFFFFFIQRFWSHFQDYTQCRRSSEPGWTVNTLLYHSALLSLSTHSVMSCTWRYFLHLRLHGRLFSVGLHEMSKSITLRLFWRILVLQCDLRLVGITISASQLWFSLFKSRWCDIFLGTVPNKHAFLHLENKICIPGILWSATVLHCNAVFGAFA